MLLRRANAGVQADAKLLRLVETTVLLQTVTAYMDVLRDLEIVRICENNIAVLTRDVEAAETRRAVQEVTENRCCPGPSAPGTSCFRR